MAIHVINKIQLPKDDNNNNNNNIVSQFDKKEFNNIMELIKNHKHLY